MRDELLCQQDYPVNRVLFHFVWNMSLNLEQLKQLHHTTKFTDTNNLNNFYKSIMTFRKIEVNPFITKHNEWVLIATQDSCQWGREG